MSLQGTLDTFSLPEILELVEKSRKTGALEVRDPQSRGVLYFAGGRFSAAEAGELNGTVESPEELEARLIDVCFTLFRVESGFYEFETDRFPPWPVRGGCEVEPIVDQVQQLRRDWLAIEVVLPSLECRPVLVDDLDGDSVVLDKAGFRVVRVVDGERNVREIAVAVGRSVLEVGRVLKDLVDAGAVVVPTDPARTVVDELVLPVDDTVEAPPVGRPAYDVRAAVRVDPVDAVFPETEEAEIARPERSLDDGYAAVDLPALPDFVVPSSPEGLADLDLPVAEPAAPEPVPDPDPAPRDYVAEAREAEQSREAPGSSPVTDDPEVPAEEDADQEAAPDRGALLRMFSSLRDT